jgi:hypothetical protein
MVDEAQALVDEVEGNKGLEVDIDWKKHRLGVC